VHHDHDHEGHTHEVVGPDGKVTKEVHVHEHEEQSNWGAWIATGWESSHIHYGVNETGDGSAYYTEVGFSVYDMTFNAWGGFGLGDTDFQEWDFTVFPTFEIGPIVISPGYNFRYTPTHGDDEHGHEDEHEHEEHGHDEEHGHEEEHHDEGDDHDHGHSHSTFEHELFVVVSAPDVIPYVTPSVAFLWELVENGGYLEFRLDGDVPPLFDRFYLEPYTLLSVDFGYNDPGNSGWNNWQFGLEGTWQINRYFSAFSSVNYSVAMENLRNIDQGNEFWVEAGVSVAVW